MYFKKFLISILLLSGAWFISPVNAELVIIVHPSNNAEINKSSVKKIFLGKTRSFLDGKPAIPIDLQKSEMRKVFVMDVLRRTSSSLDSYWSRMVFTGEAFPPKEVKSAEEMKKLVSSNPKMIGYIDSSEVDDTVKVVALQ